MVVGRSDKNQYFYMLNAFLRKDEKKFAQLLNATHLLVIMLRRIYNSFGKEIAPLESTSKTLENVILANCFCRIHTSWPAATPKSFFRKFWAGRFCSRSIIDAFRSWGAEGGYESAGWGLR